MCLGGRGGTWESPTNFMPFQIPTHIWHTGEQKGKGCQGSGIWVKNQGELCTAEVTLTPCNLYKFLSRCFVYLDIADTHVVLVSLQR